ncbi:hypothetical protein ISCGN_018501 [Ixodes scapularis]
MCVRCPVPLLALTPSDPGLGPGREPGLSLHAPGRDPPRSMDPAGTSARPALPARGRLAWGQGQRHRRTSRHRQRKCASRPRAGSAGRAEVPAGSMLLGGSRPGACSESPGSRPGPSPGSDGVSARSGTGHRTHIRRTGIVRTSRSITRI